MSVSAKSSYSDSQFAYVKIQVYNNNKTCISTKKDCFNGVDVFLMVNIPRVQKYYYSTHIKAQTDHT